MCLFKACGLHKYFEKNIAEIRKRYLVIGGQLWHIMTWALFWTWLSELLIAMKAGKHDTGSVLQCHGSVHNVVLP